MDVSIYHGYHGQSVLDYENLYENCHVVVVVAVDDKATFDDNDLLIKENFQ